VTQKLLLTQRDVYPQLKTDVCVCVCIWAGATVRYPGTAQTRGERHGDGDI
jgi:hypothetical protein